MTRIVVNKYFPNYEKITREIFDKTHGKGEIIISNEVNNEGLFIINDIGEVIRFYSKNPEELIQEIINYLENNYLTSGETMDIIQEFSANTQNTIEKVREYTFELSASTINISNNLQELSGTVKTIIENPPIDEDTVRIIANEEAALEVAKVVASADTSFDTLKEIADWIKNDTTGAAKMANDIEKLQEDVVNVSEEVTKVTEDISTTVQEYVNEAIANINSAEHVTLTREQYDTLIREGRVIITENGEEKTIIYSEYAYYMIYEE